MVKEHTRYYREVQQDIGGSIRILMENEGIWVTQLSYDSDGAGFWKFV